MQTVLRSSEFSCPSCVGKIETQVRKVPGVHNVAVHFATGRIVIEHDDETGVDELIAAVGAAGYRATARRGAASQVSS